MSEKQLTIAIPAYNSAAFIEKNLKTYLYEDGTMDPRLQLIIVNDGSKDDTAKIGREWAKKYPDNVILVDKENGGHGSGINAGIDNATGRYYKVIDSDDWIVTENLKAILDELEDTDTDVVVTGYHTINIASGVTLPYGTGQQPMPSQEQINQYGQQYATLGCFGFKEVTLEELLQNSRNIPAAQSFHGLMYNTEFYKETGIRMSEKVFFEDQEYAILPFAHVESIRLMPYFFYEYQIGSADQSVNFQNQAKRSPDFLAVFKKMSEYHKSVQPLEWANEEFIIWRLSNSAVSYYSTVLVKNDDKETGKKLAEEFRKYLFELEPEVAERCEKKYKTMSKLAGSKLAAGAYGKLFNSKFFGKFKERWTN